MVILTVESVVHWQVSVLRRVDCAQVNNNEHLKGLAVIAPLFVEEANLTITPVPSSANAAVMLEGGGTLEVFEITEKSRDRLLSIVNLLRTAGSPIRRTLSVKSPIASPSP